MAGPTTLLIGYIGRSLTTDQRRYLGLWFDKRGPYWEDEIRHSDHHQYKCCGNPVNNEAVAEATQRSREGFKSALVSIVPSDWKCSTLVVTVDDSSHFELGNFWDPEELETTLESSPPNIATWDELKELSLQRFQHLSFLEDCFDHLGGIGFSDAAAMSIISRLEDLDKLMRSRDKNGAWTPEGQRLYEDKFVGQDPKFTDSSDTEKRQFRRELTFQHPIPGEGKLFCTWHGKVKRDLIRIHFSRPDSENPEMYIAYIGRKLTTR